MRQVRIDLIAGKLERAQRECDDFKALLDERPYVRELILFLEWISRQPGGMPGFVDALIDANPDEFLIESVRKQGVPKNGRYDLAELFKIWKAESHGIDGLFDRQCPFTGFRAPSTKWGGGSSPFIDKYETLEGIMEVMREDPGVKRQVDRWISEFNFEFFQEASHESVRRHLPDRLMELCEDSMRPALDRFARSPGRQRNEDSRRWIWDILRGAMSAHADRTRQQAADTAVFRKIWRELEFARGSLVPVQIVGDSRIGKTTAGRVWAESYPGRARVVTVPHDMSEWAFFTAHADALGLDYNTTTSLAKLKREVSYVLRCTRLFLVYDEAHFLIPTRFSKNTRARRLEWVRGEVMDRGIGCAFFVTPQAYRESFDRYLRTTGYRFDQWSGRMRRPVILPDSMGRADLLAVAKLRFPEIDGLLLQLICARAMQSEGYLHSIEIVAKRALFIAREAGRTTITRSDVDQAVADELPGFSQPAAASTSAPGRQPPKRGPAVPMQGRCRPAEGAAVDTTDFQPAAQRSPVGSDVGAVLVED